MRTKETLKINNEMKPMRVLLVDVDSTIPNIALMKISTWHKKLGDNVDLKVCSVSYYPNRKKHTAIECNGYDIVYASSIFKDTLPYRPSARKPLNLLRG